jgi:hypothetical protein
LLSGPIFPENGEGFAILRILISDRADCQARPRCGVWGVSVSRRDIEYFQPARVFLGSVPDNVRAFNISLRPITLSEID